MKKLLVAGCMLFTLSTQANALPVDDAVANACFKVAAKSTIKITKLYAKTMYQACKKGMTSGSAEVDELGTRLHGKLMKAQDAHNRRVAKLVCDDADLPAVAGALNFMGLSLVDLEADGTMKDFSDPAHTSDLIDFTLTGCRS